MSLAPSPMNERKRVKVYELKDSDWWDRGTGFCAIQAILQEESLFVESEDNGRPLLQTKVEKEHNYQKQNGTETLIVWTDSDGLDMALSFQEAEGCALVWDTINQVQQRQGVESTFNLSLPDVNIENLAEIELLVGDAMNAAQSRDPFMKHIIEENWLAKLVPLVDIAESMESLPDLHRLCNIFKSLILFNENKFIEECVSDAYVMGVVGALEYDPDFPEHKANHRRYLGDKSRFKEVVPILDPKVRDRIHGTFRLQYLKDVVLARILDDPTFSILNSMIYFCQMDILSHIASNPQIIKDIFTVIMTESQPQENRKDGVLFIQQCTAIAKAANQSARGGLYSNFVTSGLFTIIQWALKNQDAAVRVAGVEIFLTIIDHDPMLMRNLIFKSVTEKTKGMTETLVDLFLAEPDLGVKAQVADAIKTLLEPNNPAGAIERSGMAADNSFVAKLRSNTQQNDAHLAAFFEGSAAKKLFTPLMELEGRTDFTQLSIAEVSLYSHLIETLSFFLRTQSHRSKQFILENNFAARVAQLLTAPQKHLKLMAVKYFRAVVQLNDEYHYRHLIRDNLFGPILDILIESLPRDNLLNSAILELFESIRKDNIKPFVLHLVETYRERLESIQVRGVTSIFAGIILRYDQLMHPETMQSAGPAEGDSSFMTSDAETPNTRHVTINGGGTRWQGLKDADADEEAYFNASDGDEDDEDELSRDAPANNAPYNASPLSKPLVDYADDDDDEPDEDLFIAAAESGDCSLDDLINAVPLKVMEWTPDDTLSSAASTSTAQVSTPTTILPSSPSPAAEKAATTPLPRLPPLSLSEKRRREEDDDEDELGKLSSRNSVSGSERSSSVERGLYGQTLKPNKRRNSAASRIDAALAAEQEAKLVVEKTSSEEVATAAPVATPSPGVRRQGSLRRKAGMQNLTPSRRRSSSRSSSSSLTAGIADVALGADKEKEKDHGGFGSAFQFQLAKIGGNANDMDESGKEENEKKKLAVMDGEMMEDIGQKADEDDVVLKLQAAETADVGIVGEQHIETAAKEKEEAEKEETEKEGSKGVATDTEMQG